LKTTAPGGQNKGFVGRRKPEKGHQWRSKHKRKARRAGPKTLYDDRKTEGKGGEPSPLQRLLPGGVRKRQSLASPDS